MFPKPSLAWKIKTWQACFINSDILSNFNSFNCLIFCSIAIIKPFIFYFSTTGKGIPLRAREPSSPWLNKLQFFHIILHFCKSAPSVISPPPPPSLPKCYLFIQGTPRFPSFIFLSLAALRFISVFILFNKFLFISMCVFFNAGNNFISESYMPPHASENFVL